MAFVGTTNILVVIATWGLGARVVISERNDPKLQSLGSVWDLLRKWTYPMADVVTANSQGALHSLRAYVPLEKLTYVPNPVSVAKASGRSPTQETHSVLAVGRLVRQKAYDILLSAFAIVAADLEDWTLTLVGEGELLDSLKNLALSLGIDARVEWIGSVSDPTPYYERASIFVLSSRHEGTPNALLEAMSFGLPVIVSDALSGPMEYVEEGKSGLVVPADDTSELAAAICKLARDEGLRMRLGKEAKQRVAKYPLSDVLAIWNNVLGLEVRDLENGEMARTRPRLAD